jgi:hypothetical protein
LKKVLDIPVKFIEKKPITLLIEINRVGIALLWVANNPKKIIGAEVFSLAEQESLDILLTSILADIRQNKNKPEKIKVFYDTLESVLIPGEFFKNEIEAETLNLMFGEDDDAIVKSEHINELNIQLVYRIPKKIESLLISNFPKAKFCHSTTKQVKTENPSNRMSCIIFNNVVKVILYKSGQLQIVKHFSFTTHEDVAYHLLNTCSVYDVDPSSVQLSLLGMVTKESTVFQTLHNYFLDIDFDNNASAIQMGNEFLELPKHYLGHLIELAQ